MINIRFNGQNPIYYHSNLDWQLPTVTGAVQWNGRTRAFEVSDGVRWYGINNTIEIRSDIDMNAIAQWVMRKMDEEEKEKELRSKYPSLDQAYKDLEFIKGLIADDIQQNQRS